MFQLYLLLRLKNFGRIVIELGIFRIVFLTILTAVSYTHLDVYKRQTWNNAGTCCAAK